MGTPRGSGDRSLVAGHDVLLLDLDGVVYTGATAVPGAAATLAEAAAAGVGLIYVTNNASRSARSVAEHLRALGFPASDADVVTSADAAADHLATTLPAGAPVLVVGGPGLVEAVAGRGLRPVTRAADRPVAVVQGFGPALGWSVLAEAAYVLATGVPWVATNRDLTVPTERGLAPGNGAFVLALEAATGRAPSTIGKPEPALFQTALARAAARQPLVVGDRLDTDVLGARRAGLPSLLVMTGVTTVADLLSAPADRRPDHVASSLAGLLAVPAPVAATDTGTGPEWTAGGWRAVVDGERLVLVGAGEPDDALRVAAAASWAAIDGGHRLRHDQAVALLVERLAQRR